MSLRLLSTKLMKHGKYFLQAIWKREIHTNILEQQHKTRNRLTTSTAQALKSAVSSGPKQQQQQLVAKNLLQNSLGTGSQTRPANGIFRFGQHARKLFIDNLLNRCTTTYSEQLRSEATKKLFYGDSAPFFALIGVSLASGAGILTKEDELEGVCWEIREAASKLQRSWNYDEVSPSLSKDFNIDKLDIGPPIAKGCAAVVYAASFKNNEIPKQTRGEESVLSESNLNVSRIETTDDLLAAADDRESSRPIGDGLHNTMIRNSFRPDFMSPLENMSRFVHNFGSSVDNLQAFVQTSTVTHLREALESFNHENEDKENQKVGEKSLENLSKAAEGVSSLKNTIKEDSFASSTDLIRYPLALKMMFNYDIQSNALSILRAMYKETVPARQRYINPEAEGWERLLEDQTLTIPPHPNIVTMFGFFCDEVKSFPDGHLLYPIAQPQRINPNGYGRNMSLYLLMKRYDHCLKNLLETEELSSRTKVLLFAQLLEAVAHINSHGIAHRDLKSDNILIEMNDDDSPPVLVLSDFGCCLADKVNGLKIPYNSLDIDKGGNAALMAPEIINKQPGSFAVLNYSKADLWACGAIAYEIFGQNNPFYALSQKQKEQQGIESNFQALKNSNYKAEELPDLNETCPELVRNLIYNILEPNPARRVSPDIAANVMQLYLWAPSKWLKAGELPNSPEIMQWLLSLTTKIMCEGRALAGNSVAGLPQQLNFSQHGRRTYVEYLLIASFLSRARLRRIRGALSWIQNIN